jgi:ubiquinone/menaquinone biosynthesis C-methylase UbiE
VAGFATVMSGREAWVPDELRTAGRENLDAEHVARYDDKEDAGALDDVTLLRTLGLRPDATVVDLGAGTGQFSLTVAEHVARVVAVDVSPVMLAHLGAKLRRSGVENVECARAGFLTYEHTGPPAQLVYSRYALHHLPDFWKAVALTRMAAMLEPGGILRLWDVVYGFDVDDTASALERWFDAGASGSVDDGWTRAELEEHVRDEHSTFTWLLEPMVEQAGFAIESVDYTDDRMSARYVCRRPA